MKQKSAEIGTGDIQLGSGGVNGFARKCKSTTNNEAGMAAIGTGEDIQLGSGGVKESAKCKFAANKDAESAESGIGDHIQIGSGGAKEFANGKLTTNNEAGNGEVSKLNQYGKRNDAEAAVNASNSQNCKINISDLVKDEVSEEHRHKSLVCTYASSRFMCVGPVLKEKFSEFFNREHKYKYSVGCICVFSRFRSGDAFNCEKEFDRSASNRKFGKRDPNFG